MQWIESFLVERTISVRLDSKLSDWSKTQIGVPQRFVLDSIFYLLRLNDCLEEFSCQVALFADDIEMFAQMICKQFMRILTGCRCGETPGHGIQRCQMCRPPNRQYQRLPASNTIKGHPLPVMDKQTH